MLPVLAHAVGSGQFPVPLWFIAVFDGVGLLLVALYLRLTRTKAGAPWPEDAPAERPGHPVAVVVGRVLGLVGWAVTVVAAFVGPGDDATNIAYYAALYGLFLGGAFLSLVAGDVWRHIDPFDTLARILGAPADTRDPERPGPTWTAPVLLGTYGWTLVAFHLRNPRVVGVWLVGYTVVVLAGAHLWGRAWLRRGEGFAVLHGLLGRLAPWRRRLGRGGDVDEGGTWVLVVAAAIAVFSAVRGLFWWQVEVMGTRTGWARTVVDTTGFVFVVAVIGTVWVGATRAASRSTGEREPWGVVLLPAVAGLLVAKFVSLCVSDGWNLVALASDPFGKRWNLFGTFFWLPNFRLATSALLSWIEVLAVLLGGALAMFLAQDAALSVAGSRRKAAAAVLPVQGALVALSVVGLELVLRA